MEEDTRSRVKARRCRVAEACGVSGRGCWDVVTSGRRSAAWKVVPTALIVVTRLPAVGQRTDNVFIEGDNLDVLPTLEPGSVDLIYTDPPYNTGNDFAYADSFRSDGGGRASRHEAWVAMMRPRLVAMRDVLGRTVPSSSASTTTRRHTCDSSSTRSSARPTSSPRSSSTSTPRAASRVVASRRATNTSSPTPATPRAACSTPAAPTPSTRTTSHCAPRTAEPSATSRCATPTRSSTRSRRPPALSVYGDPLTGDVGHDRLRGGPGGGPVFGDGRPAVWRWSRPRIDERPDDLVCGRSTAGTAPGSTSSSGTGCTATAGSQEAAHHLALRGDRLHRHRGRRAQGADRARLESPKPTGLVRRILATMPPDAVVLDPFAGSGTTGHAVALANAADGGTRTCISIDAGRADPTGVEHRQRRVRDRRRHHPGAARRRDPALGRT